MVLRLLRDKGYRFLHKAWCCEISTHFTVAHSKLINFYKKLDYFDYIYWEDVEGVNP